MSLGLNEEQHSLALENKFGSESTPHKTHGHGINVQFVRTTRRMSFIFNSTSSALIATPVQVVGCGSESSHLIEKVVLRGEFKVESSAKEEERLLTFSISYSSMYSCFSSSGRSRHS